jgi:hypothetical protein
MSHVTTILEWCATVWSRDLVRWWWLAPATATTQPICHFPSEKVALMLEPHVDSFSSRPSSTEGSNSARVSELKTLTLFDIQPLESDRPTEA